MPRLIPSARRAQPWAVPLNYDCSRPFRTGKVALGSYQGFAEIAWQRAVWVTARPCAGDAEHAPCVVKRAPCVSQGRIRSDFTPIQGSPAYF